MEEPLVGAPHVGCILKRAHGEDTPNAQYTEPPSRVWTVAERFAFQVALSLWGGHVASGAQFPYKSTGQKSIKLSSCTNWFWTKCQLCSWQRDRCVTVFTSPGWAEGGLCLGPVSGVFYPSDLFGLLLPGPEVARLLSLPKTISHLPCFPLGWI